MKKPIISLVILLFSIVSATAQYSETISSGRPGQAIGGNTTGKNVFQIQTGIDYFSDTKLSIPNSFFRYSLTDVFELNSGVAYSFMENENGLSAFTIGSRINLYKGKDGKFPIGVQISTQIPVGELQSSTSVIFATSTSLTDKLGLALNLGTSFTKDVDPSAQYAVNFSYAINNKVAVFIEPYGSISNTISANIDTGFSYLVNNNLLLDVLGGYGLNTNQGLFIGGGFSWRTKL